MDIRISGDDPEVTPHVLIKLIPFQTAMLALGRDKVSEQARILELDTKTLQKAVAGGKVGDKFIANTIAAFRPHANRLSRYGLAVTMDQFFEVPAEMTP